MEEIFFQKSQFRLSGILRGHSAEITRLCFSDDGSMLASVQDASDEVWIWALDAQVLLRRLPGSDMAFSPDGSVLAVIDEGITLWECATWQRLEHLLPHPTFLAFSSDGKALILMDALGHFSLFDLATKQSVFAFDALADLSRPGRPAASSNGSCLALPTSSNQAHLWLFDHTSREALYLETIPADFEECLAFSPDGAFLATLVAGKRRQRVRLHRVGNQEDLGYLEPDVGPIWRGLWPLESVHTRKRIQKERVLPTQALAFSPDSTYLVAAAPDGILFLWNVPERRLIASFAAHPDPDAREVNWSQSSGIRSIAWSKSRNYLATGGWEERKTEGWDLTTQGWKFRTEPIDDGEFIIKLWSFQ